MIIFVRNKFKDALLVQMVIPILSQMLSPKTASLCIAMLHMIHVKLYLILHVLWWPEFSVFVLDKVLVSLGSLFKH